MAPFRANGVITLTTDFGTREPFVGIMKGVILARARDLSIVDMAHDVSAFDPLETGFWVSRALRYFAAGTVHVAVVDPGVGSARDVVIATVGEQVVLAPDNGLLAPLAALGHIDRLHRVDFARLGRWGIQAVSATFHGRDVFAPLAATLAAGRCQPGELGEQIAALGVAGYPASVALASGGRGGVIVAIDRFGNLISNIEAESTAALSEPWVKLAGLRLPLRRTYADVAPGAYVALVNSFDVIEVAQAQGNAAAGLAIGKGAPIEVQSGASDSQIQCS